MFGTVNKLINVLGSKTKQENMLSLIPVFIYLYFFMLALFTLEMINTALILNTAQEQKVLK